jgi:hypothetical protein
VCVGEPLQDRVPYELRTAVGTHVSRRAMRAHQARQHVDNSARADALGYVDRQALVCEFVDHRQTLELLAVGAVLEHEIVRQDMVGGSCNDPALSAQVRLLRRTLPPVSSYRGLDAAAGGCRS